jgi:hypothetical protein
VIRFTSHDRAHHPMIGAARPVPGHGTGLTTPVPAGHRTWKFVDIASLSPSGEAKAP